VSCYLHVHVRVYTVRVAGPRHGDVRRQDAISRNDAGIARCLYSKCSWLDVSLWAVVWYVIASIALIHCVPFRYGISASRNSMIVLWYERKITCLTCHPFCARTHKLKHAEHVIFAQKY
jgi:hypothetical protein